MPMEVFLTKEALKAAFRLQYKSIWDGIGTTSCRGHLKILRSVLHREIIARNYPVAIQDRINWLIQEEPETQTNEIEIYTDGSVNSGQGVMVGVL